MSLPKITSSDLYGVYSEMDAIMVEYADHVKTLRAETDDDKRLNSYELFLKELNINSSAFGQAGKTVALAMLSLMKDWQDDGTFGRTRNSMAEAVKGFTGNKIETEKLTFLICVWCEGFLCGAMLAERQGVSWDEIDFKRISELKTSPEGNNKCKKLLNNGIFKTAGERCAQLFYALQGQRKPMILPPKVNRMITLTTPLFCDGLASAYFFLGQQ